MKKKRRDYSDRRYEQELAERERKCVQEQAKAGNGKGNPHTFVGRVLLPEFTDILLNNLKFLLISLPVILCLGAAMMIGGIIFLVGAWLCSFLMGPAMAALYHRAYEYTCRVSPLARTSFFSFFRSNFWPAAGFGLVLGFLWILCGVYLVGAKQQQEVPFFVCFPFVIVVLFLVSYYTITVMVQLSQFELPAKAMLKNAVILLAACGWRGVLPAFLQTLYLILLFQNLSIGVLLLLLGVPNMIISLAVYLLWPRLKVILIDHVAEA